MIYNAIEGIGISLKQTASFVIVAYGKQPIRSLFSIYIYIYGQRYIPLLEKKILYILRNRKRKIPITLPRKELGMGLMPSIGGGRNTCLSSQMRSNPPTRISFPCRLYKSSKRMSGREEGVNGIVWKNRDPSPHRSTPTWTPAKNKFAT